MEGHTPKKMLPVYIKIMQKILSSLCNCSLNSQNSANWGKGPVRDSNLPGIGRDIAKPHLAKHQISEFSFQHSILVMIHLSSFWLTKETFSTADELVSTLIFWGSPSRATAHTTFQLPELFRPSIYHWHWLSLILIVNSNTTRWSFWRGTGTYTAQNS